MLLPLNTNTNTNDFVNDFVVSLPDLTTNTTTNDFVNKFVVSLPDPTSNMHTNTNTDVCPVKHNTNTNTKVLTAKTVVISLHVRVIFVNNLVNDVFVNDFERNEGPHLVKCEIVKTFGEIGHIDVAMKLMNLMKLMENKEPLKFLTRNTNKNKNKPLPVVMVIVNTINEQKLVLYLRPWLGPFDEIKSFKFKFKLRPWQRTSKLTDNAMNTKKPLPVDITDINEFKFLKRKNEF